MRQRNPETAVVTANGAKPKAPTRFSARGIVSVVLLLGFTAGALSGCVLVPVPGFCGPGSGFGGPPPGPPGPRPYWR